MTLTCHSLSLVCVRHREAFPFFLSLPGPVPVARVPGTGCDKFGSVLRDKRSLPSRRCGSRCMRRPRPPTLTSWGPALLLINVDPAVGSRPPARASWGPVVLLVFVKVANPMRPARSASRVMGSRRRPDKTCHRAEGVSGPVRGCAAVRIMGFRLGVGKTRNGAEGFCDQYARVRAVIMGSCPKLQKTSAGAGWSEIRTRRLARRSISITAGTWIEPAGSPMRCYRRDPIGAARMSWGPAAWTANECGSTGRRDLDRGRRPW